MNQVKLFEGSFCVLAHKCVICGAVAMYPHHGTRGHTWKMEGESNCPGGFLVRCDPCRREGKKPPQGMSLAIELGVNATTEEIQQWSQQSNIVYEIM
jgi:hypothetical protein